VLHDGLELGLTDAAHRLPRHAAARLAQIGLGGGERRGDDGYFTDRRVDRRRLFAAAQGGGLPGKRLDGSSQLA
jgi:hypothetical protein